ncbi:pilus assembly protein [Polaromonas sp. SM01]|uniref:pilus assembly protein n=1 Tax=Polaromonas sp. SM01 TaxID=3085630 RepID=UPI0029815252|nr:PilC/PilY family type IV pilus protein [Polaromonas sp. SM01]MDW5443222.1 PilC/PilY family type IV pilus protein [Polaromonas sp. SM01]
MFFATFLCSPIRALLVGLPLLMIFIPGVQSQPVPAQIPLLNISGGGVTPNLMLTMDDSGSMHFQHIPENLFAGGTFATVNPVGSQTVRWDPRDDYQVGVNFAGTVPGNINSTNYVLRALRSPDTNSIFYNPETLYRPWMTSDGVTRLPNSPAAAAYKDPLIRTGVAASVIDLTSYTAPGGSSNWCNFNTTDSFAAGSFVVGMSYQITASGTTNFTSIGASNNNVGRNFTATGVGAGTGTAKLRNNCDNVNNNTASLNHDPGVYFRLQKQNVNAGSFVTGTTYTITTVGTTNFTSIGAASNTVGVAFTATGAGSGTGVAQGYKAVNNYANYTGYSINVAASFSKVAARTDCSGAVGATGCTQAQERQNFANWFTYYRTRNLLARGSMMESFANVGNTIRLGFGRINKGSAAVDGVNTTVIESNTTLYGGGGVRDFTQARKNQLYKWLEDLPASGGTPLPAALDAVGRYYSRTDGRGPYTDDPSVSNVTTNNKTCRRSYQLMVTDGYWNGTPPTVGDLDSTAGTQMAGGSYTFAANTKPYADGFTDTLADVAMKYWKNDLQPNIANKVVANSVDPSYWQSMTNFMVGLGVRGDLDPAIDLPALTAGTKSWAQPSESASLPANIDDLWHAAVNSRGAYYSAKDPASLAAAIAGALAGAQGGTGATAGVATVSSVLQNGNRKYVPTFNGSVWNGDISAQPLDANGQTTAAVWSAAARMPAWNSRNIFTWDTAPISSPLVPGAVAFNWGALSSANQTAMTSGSLNLVNFLRGDHSNEVSLAAPSNPFRERKDATGTPFVLGDFVNSNPVLIKGLFDGGYSSLNLGGTNGYQIFTAAKTARDAVLFVGGNDGMLHGFKDVNAQPPLASTASTDGREVFAYVPRTVYPDLYKLSDKSYGATVPHKFYVDGPQREFDAFVAGPAYPAFSGHPACAAGATCWRNYLMGSLGAGGRAVYALDVTSSPNLNASNIRWEISSATDSDLGYVLAPIEVGVLPSGKWVAIFGNGFSSTNGYATLFIVDLATAAITKLNVDTSGSNGLGGVGVIRNSFGQITNLYAGDLKGKLWKFDYNTPSVPFVVSGGAALFTATGPSSLAQAITQPPSLFDHSLGGKIVVFGTGKLLTAADQVNTDAQTIYGIWDKPADSVSRPLSRSALAARTLTATSGTGSAATRVFYSLAGASPNWATQRGWYIDLSPAITGGRVIYPSQSVTSALVLVTAVAPPQSAEVCDSSTGIGIDFVFGAELGAAATTPIFDTNGDGVVNSHDALVIGVQTASVGIRALVKGIGGGTICEPGYTLISKQQADGQDSLCVKDPTLTPTRLFQRIQRRIINPPIR